MNYVGHSSGKTNFEKLNIFISALFITNLVFKTCKICDFIEEYLLKSCNFDELSRRIGFLVCPEHTDFWYAKDLAFDQLIRTRFEAIHRQACAVELWSWRHTPEGRLAEIIVLDQFSRNLYRDNASAFAQDPLALGLAQEAIALKLDAQLSPEQRSFYICRLCTVNPKPFMSLRSNCFSAWAMKPT